MGQNPLKRDISQLRLNSVPTVKNLAKLLPKDKNTLVVAYCGGPGCSAYKRGAAAAEKLGYKNIKHLSAGISGWKKAGGELAKEVST